MNDEPNPFSARRMALYDRLPRHWRDLLKAHPHVVNMTEEQLNEIGFHNIQRRLQRLSKEEGY